RLERAVRDADAASAVIRLRAIPSVTRFRRVLGVGRRTALPRGLDPGSLQHLAGLLRARFRQQRPQLADRGVLLADRLDQVAQRLDCTFEPPTILFAQWPLARPLHEPRQL